MARKKASKPTPTSHDKCWKCGEAFDQGYLDGERNRRQLGVFSVRCPHIDPDGNRCGAINRVTIESVQATYRIHKPE